MIPSRDAGHTREELDQDDSLRLRATDANEALCVVARIKGWIKNDALIETGTAIPAHGGAKRARELSQTNYGEALRSDEPRRTGRDVFFQFREFMTHSGENKIRLRCLNDPSATRLVASEQPSLE